MCFDVLTGNKMCKLMKGTTLLLLLLHCSSGITVRPISYVMSLVLTATFEFSSLPRVQSTETSIVMLVTTEDVNSVAITSMMNPASRITPSATLPVPSPSLPIESTEIIVFPTDIMTESVLFTTDTDTVNTSSILLSATLTSVITIPVVSSDVGPLTSLFSSTESNSNPTLGLTTALVTTFESVSSAVTDQISVTPVTPMITFTTSTLGTTSLTGRMTITSSTISVSPTTILAATTPVVMTTSIISTSFTTSLEATSTQFSTISSSQAIPMDSVTTFTSLTIQTLISSLRSPTIISTVTPMSLPSDAISSTLPVVTVTLAPSPTPTAAPPNLVFVLMRFRIPPTIKRDAGNYSNIESNIANATGISAERINIVSVTQESNETIVINATIVELNLTEFTTLNATINSGMVSITYEGRIYTSSSIELQSQSGIHRLDTYSVTLLWCLFMYRM